MATATVVRRSARLAATRLGDSGQLIVQRRAELVPYARPSSRGRSISGDRAGTCNDRHKGSPLDGVVPLQTEIAVEEMETVVTIDLKEHKTKQIAVRHTKPLPSRDMEVKLWELGYQHVAGVDEAGRGPLAGPVVAAACIIPASVTISGVDDSKRLTEERREELYSQIITTRGVTYAVHVVDAATIDEVNILQATLQAMAACVKKLSSHKNQEAIPDYILVDGNRLPDEFSEDNAECVVKGDAKCHVIAAASILAKVTRDRMMLAYDKKWPEYGFRAHKGYGTVAHIAALLKYGPCHIHRRSFAPLKDQLLLTKDLLP